MVPVPQSHLSGDNVGGPPMTSSPQLRPLGELLGTEALGIDLSRPLDQSTFAWIGRVFAEPPVLGFRDQNLGPAELAAFGRWFGRPRMHALIKYRHAEYPEVSWLTNVEDDGKVDWYGVKRATDWHTDSTYEVDPPILAILHAKEIPSSKGGTMFADMCAAYDALPKTMKDRLSTLVGLHGRSTGPAGERLYGDDRRNRKGISRNAAARGDRAPGDRSADPVRQPDAHAWFHRHDAGGSLAADRGTGRARDAGSFRLLPSLARR